MLAFIGVIALLWIAFKVLNNSFSAAVLGMQVQAIEYATECSVPRLFAAHVCENPQIIKLAIQTMTRAEPGFAQRPRSEKYGRAIVYLYACHLQSEAKEVAKQLPAIKGKLAKFIGPQINELEAGGFHLYLDEVVYAYVGALAGTMAGGVVNPAQIHELVQSIFKDKASAFALENAYRTIQIAELDFIDKMAALIPLATQELASCKPAYLVKHIKKVNLRFEEMGSGEVPDWRDRANVSLQQYLGLDD